MSAPWNEDRVAELRKALRYKRVSFWERVLKGREDECWPWLGGLTGPGYGLATVNRKLVLAHRHAYETVVGPIPEGLTIDHLCQNKPCINTAHMEVVTRGENARRGEKNRKVRSSGRWMASRTHCKNGHEFTSENVRIEGNTRRCLPCARERSRQFRARKAA